MKFKSMSKLTGKLFVVATPIGNLEDITYRAIETLKTVDTILAEDTRKTKILLNHYEINTKVISYRDQNHDRIFPQILNLLQNGKNLALVSDSGTPLISDPGFKLVKALLELEIEVISIPGPSAVTASLSICGLPTDNFTFLGFLPKGSGKRAKILEIFGKLETTLVIYESPYRLVKLLEQIKTSLGDRTVFVANELTKKFEKKWRGKIHKIVQEVQTKKQKGEFIVVVGKENFE